MEFFLEKLKKNAGELKNNANDDFKKNLKNLRTLKKNLKVFTEELATPKLNQLLLK